MPITLGPISRRRFLTASAGAAVLALGARWGLGAPAGERDPDRIALLSDVHIHSDPTTVNRGINMTQHLKQAVAEVLELEKSNRRPAATIVNGDCAYLTGQTDDYQALTGLLQPLAAAGLPIHLAMGNHDRRDHFRATVPYERFERGAAIQGMETRQTLILRSPRVDWVILDTLDKTNKTPGLLGPEQLQWLKGVLDAPDRSGKPVLVLIHHDPVIGDAAKIAATRPSKITGLTDTAALLDVVMPRKQVKALVFGHTHRWEMAKLDGLHLINLPTVAYVFQPKQPAGWVDCRIFDKSMRLELRCLDHKHPKHGEVLDFAWRA